MAQFLFHRKYLGNEKKIEIGKLLIIIWFLFFIIWFLFIYFLTLLEIGSLFFIFIFFLTLLEIGS